MCPPIASSEQGDRPAATSFANLPAALKATIPPHQSCKDALDLAVKHLPASIFNHSFRVYLYARHLAWQESPPGIATSKPHLLFAACILHDIGTVRGAESPERFEVVGGDAAKAHLEQYEDIDKQDRDAVWQAIALHTSPGIAERMIGLVRLVRLAVLVDFGKSDILEGTSLETGTAAMIRQSLPRYDIEKELSDAVVQQAEAVPAKAPAASWPGILLRSKKENPDWTGVNKAF